MFVKRFKKKCDVRGCKNITDVFVISKRREMGNSIAICRECMKDALASTEGYVEPPKPTREVKPLFPHPELKKVTISSVAEDIKPTEAIEETEDIQISVAEDTVTTEEPIIATAKPDVVLPNKATQTSNAKKKPNKKK